LLDATQNSFKTHCTAIFDNHVVSQNIITIIYHLWLQKRRQGMERRTKGGYKRKNFLRLWKINVIIILLVLILIIQKYKDIIVLFYITQLHGEYHLYCDCWVEVNLTEVLISCVISNRKLSKWSGTVLIQKYKDNCNF